MKNNEMIYLGADHAGFEAKEFIKDLLQKSGHKIEDLGTFDKESVDYPDYAQKVAEAVIRNKHSRGILTCGTGIGASIAANKMPGIRAALVHNIETARSSREHNDANILVLEGRPFDKNLTENMLKVWLTTEFQGGRHLRRLEKIMQMERKYHDMQL